MSGPLPKPQSRRRNPPTIPTTSLPVSGRKGRTPRVPSEYKLGDAGRAWWKWAWGLPQAMAWDSGSLYALARRARLEDDVVALRSPPKLDLEPIIEMIAVSASTGESDLELLRSMAEHIRYVLGVFKSLAGQKSVIEREMRELDDRFGLTPKGLAALRWKIVEDPDQAAAAPVSAPKEKVRRLRAVDPRAAAG